MSWLNTNTVRAASNDRQGPVPEVLQLLRQHVRQRVAVRRTSTGDAAGGLRPRLRAVNRPWISDATRTALIAWAGTADDGPRHAAAAALLRAAGNDPWRTRRTGDVRCAASNAKRSSSPASATSARGRRSRSRTRRSTASPRPHAADLTRRRLLQWGVAGFASVYGAQELGFEQVWESVAAAPTRRGPVPRPALSGGRQRRPERPIPNEPTTTRPTASRGPNPSHAARRHGTDASAPSAARPRRRGAGVLRPRVPRRRRQLGDVNYGLRHALRQRHGRRRVGPGGHARGRRQAVQPQPLRQLGHLVPGDQRREHQDGLAGPLDGALRLGHQPAAGDLDRHRALEGDPHVGQPGVRDPVAADGRVHDELEHNGGVNGFNVNAQVRSLAQVPAARATRISGARARPTTSRSRPPALSADVGDSRPTATPVPRQHLPERARDAAADRRAPAGGEPRHAGHHDPLGRLRHPHRPVAGQDRQLDEFSRALARLPGRPAARGIEQHVARSCSASSAAACARTAPGPRPAPTTARAA